MGGSVGRGGGATLIWVNAKRLPVQEDACVNDTTVPYRIKDGVPLIEMNLNSVDQLFNSLDPSPFREKDLDSDAESYLVGAVDEFPLRAPLRIVFHLPSDQVASPGAVAIGEAIHHYFAYSLETERRKLRFVFREGRTSLLIGVAFLFVCVALRQLILTVDIGTLNEIPAEGLLIAGWVAMWRPLDTFLYGWWPLRHHCRVYAKLADIPVEVQPAQVVPAAEFARGG